MKRIACGALLDVQFNNTCCNFSLQRSSYVGDVSLAMPEDVTCDIHINHHKFSPSLALLLLNFHVVFSPFSVHVHPGFLV